MVLMATLVALPSSASASSRFGIDQVSPTRARVQIDFTIVIPETILIGFRIAEVRDSASFNSSGARDDLKLRGDGSVLIVGNSGTLAFGPGSHASSQRMQRQATQSGLTRNFPVNFLVAIP